jgi:hypothetical protein
MLRPFAPFLHLHQHKSSRYMHLQYSVRSQSTPRCQSLITEEWPSTGPEMLMVLNLPLDECHDNTHSHQFRKARNMRNEQIQTSDQKPNQKQGQDHLNKKVSVPSGKGNDSTNWDKMLTMPTPRGEANELDTIGKREKHKAQLRRQKELPLQECKLRLNKCVQTQVLPLNEHPSSYMQSEFGMQQTSPPYW